MKQTLPPLTALLLSLLAAGARAQTPAPAADSATFLLHKFEQRIGKETYRLTRSAQQHTYDVQFRFVDRGTPVPLRARFTLTPGGEPLSLVAKGNTSRFSTINDSLQMLDGGTRLRVHHAQGEDITDLKLDPKAAHFPTSGYSPATGQWLLLRYWQQHGRPAALPLLPAGTVRIREDGHDTLTFENRPLVLTRYVLKGLVWGNELLWTDPQGRLACIITNDAEGDKIEMLRQPYAALLPTLIARAATHGMRLFAAEMAAGPAPGPAPQTAKSTKPAVLAIVGGTVIDVVQGISLPRATVLVEGGRITQVGPADKVRVPKQAQVIRAEGKTIVPGLWDMHAHFQQAEWGPAYLAAGVTTVRDCGNEFSYINAIEQAINSGRGVGPRILKAGIIDGDGKRPLGIVRANNAAEAAQVVQRYKAAGFQQIKLYSSLRPDVVQAICQEAHRQGLTVTGHIPDGMTALQGINAGMDQINHLPFVAQLFTNRPDRTLVLDDTTATRVIGILKARGTVIDPTLGVYEITARSAQDDIRAIEPDFQRLPQPLQALFQSMGTTPERAAQARPILASFGQLTRRLYDAGIPIVAGTDMGFPGSSLARELELYVQAGLTPLQALQCATITPARVMQLQQRSGSIEAGKQADLLILDANPLEQIRNVRRVRLVIKEGQVYEPARMRELADFGK
ncbi:amidohydrolase family protein [Hymenobacter jeollabukensis]|uniref:Amidohydrolase n=1 Tax=Hymenobacter jeollabukensis TaxID=2025313 RepID=A0A5R8WSG8_9BACT|nr:amidohydrolase family protein [Hymenobacter jeollabukensis]TLM94102.1 amidohydrolase [Hymenobacter jeollabukensis]